MARRPTRSISVADNVRKVIIEQLCVDENELTPEAVFRRDLGADSLDAIAMLMAFEDEFGIEIPDRDAATLRCVCDVVRYVQLRVLAGHSAEPT